MKTQTPKLTREQALSEFGIDAEGLRLNMGGCQQRADDFYRGWEAWTPGSGELHWRANHAYKRMTQNHGSLRIVSRAAFVAGFVAAGLA
jgi:hypothetical protein